MTEGVRCMRGQSVRELVGGRKGRLTVLDLTRGESEVEVGEQVRGQLNIKHTN